MGPGEDQTDSATVKKRIAIWIGVRIIGTALLGLALAFGLISPVLGVALILTFIVGSNFTLRLLAEVRLRSLLPYAVYVCGLLVLLALWFFSIISALVVLVTLVPFALGYLVLSYSGKLK